MNDVGSNALMFLAAAANYCLHYERHIRCSVEVATAAQRGNGSVAYRKAEWAQTDVNNTATEMDHWGRLFVAELAPRLELGGVVEYGTTRICRIADNIVRVTTGDDHPDEGVDLSFYADKSMEHPARTPSPVDWLLLATAVPTLTGLVAETTI